MGEIHEGEISRLHFAWELLIFVAAVVSVTAVAIEFTVELDHETEHQLHIVDFSALCLFVVDIVWKFRRYHGSSLAFVRGNWLDILAIIPIFRIFRIGRFARLARIGRVSKITKAAKVTKAAQLSKAAKVGEISKAVKVGEISKAGKLAKAGKVSHVAEAGKVGRITEATKKGQKVVTGVSHSEHIKHDIEHESHKKRGFLKKIMKKFKIV